METLAYSRFEKSPLINELMEGMELAKQLKAQMGSQFPVQSQEKLLQQIVSSYDKALFILGWGGPSDQPHQLLPAMSLSPVSTVGSPMTDARNVHNCWATKQVQKSDEDPTIFHITYKGKHTCNQERRSKSAPVSPGKPVAYPVNHQNIKHQKGAAMDLSFQDTQIIDSFPFSWKEFSCLNGDSTSFLPSTVSNTDSFYGSFSPSLISPSTSGSNYFSMSPCTTDTFASLQNEDQHLDHDFSEMLSVTLSPTESPTIEPGFSLGTWSFNQNFPANDL